MEESQEANPDSQSSLILLIFQIYPLVYEFLQFYGSGLDYFADIGNFIDLLYILTSISMTVVHTVISQYHWTSVAIMCLNVIFGMRRTFIFLRIFYYFSPIVVMLSNVIVKLLAFMTFYFIQCLLFSLMFSVLGLGNFKIDGKFR